jgi:hypothetical protein
LRDAQVAEPEMIVGLAIIAIGHDSRSLVRRRLGLPGASEGPADPAATRAAVQEFPAGAVRTTARRSSS